jgi:hypothetical protein
MGNDKTDWGVMAGIVTVGLCGVTYLIWGAITGKDTDKDIGEKAGAYAKTAATSVKNSLSNTFGLKGGTAIKRRKTRAKAK